jgi:thiosulfate dehydrogenase [quinone] large subunit
VTNRPWQVTAGSALLPLRIFLGVTFAYAGFQKLADPGFLKSGAPTYIGTQLHGFAAGTPGGFVLRWLAEPFPVAAGLGVAVFEIAIGLLVLAGLYTRWAALCGMLLNLLLFLTASWNTYPYFLGSDIVFVFAWLPFVLAGASEQRSLDGYLDARERERLAYERRRLERAGRAEAAGTGAGTGAGATFAATATVAAAATVSAAPAPTRTADVATGFALTRAVAIASVAAAGLAGIAALFHGHGGSGTAAPRIGGRRSPGGSGGATGPSAGPPPQGVPASAVRLGRASLLKPGEAAEYTDPTDGNPDILIRLPDGTLSALSAICTHAGCTVDYQGGVLVCPCHGSQFSASTGAVLQGPATAPLPRRRVKQVKGEIYALRA